MLWFRRRLEVLSAWLPIPPAHNLQIKVKQRASVFPYQVRVTSSYPIYLWAGTSSRVSQTLFSGLFDGINFEIWVREGQIDGD